MAFDGAAALAGTAAAFPVFFTGFAALDAGADPDFVESLETGSLRTVDLGFAAVFVPVAFVPLEDARGAAAALAGDRLAGLVLVPTPPFFLFSGVGSAAGDLPEAEERLVAVERAVVLSFLVARDPDCRLGAVPTEGLFVLEGAV